METVKPARRELGLEHLFQHVVAGADGEELEGDGSGGRVGRVGRRRHLEGANGAEGSKGAHAGEPVSIGVPVDDLLTIDSGSESLADGRPGLNGGRPGIERNDIGEQERIIDDGDIGVLLHPGARGRAGSRRSAPHPPGRRSLVIGWSTTAMTRRSMWGGPPSVCGKPGFRSNTQRRLASCRTKRKGPLPTGCSFHAGWRMRSRGYVVEQVTGQDREIGEHIGEAILGCRPVEHEGGIIGRGHAGRDRGAPPGGADSR